MNQAPKDTLDNGISAMTRETPAIGPGLEIGHMPSTRDILSACELMERLNPQRKWTRRVFTMSGVNLENFNDLQKIAESQKSSDEWVIEKLQYNFSSMDLIITDRIRKK